MTVVINGQLSKCVDKRVTYYSGVQHQRNWTDTDHLCATECIYNIKKKTRREVRIAVWQASEGGSGTSAYTPRRRSSLLAVLEVSLYHTENGEIYYGVAKSITDPERTRIALARSERDGRTYTAAAAAQGISRKGARARRTDQRPE